MKVRVIQRYDGVPYTLHSNRKRVDKDGNWEWIEFWEQTECCDCGLVHDVRFRFRLSGELEIMCNRNKRATGQKRRWKKK